MIPLSPQEETLFELLNILENLHHDVRVARFKRLGDTDAGYTQYLEAEQHLHQALLILQEKP